MTHKSLFSMLFLLMAVALTYVSWPHANNRSIVTAQGVKAKPDAWMEKVDAIFMDKEGQMLMRIHSPTVTHYAKDDTTLLTTPELLLYRRSSKPWRIQAGKATATGSMRQIRLSETVILHHPGDEFQPVTWVNTDKII